MKTFHCDHCQQLVFFENIQCVKCEHPLAYLPDLEEIGSLEQVRAATPGKDLWRSPAPEANGKNYRLCENYKKENVCNWAIRDDDPHALCESCRLTRVIPDLTMPNHLELWYRMEVAKRRLVYQLVALKLPLANKTDDPERGLAFEFLADSDDGKPPILTGHAAGVITINIAEADSAEREKRRLEMHEPYRTLLGHFRHEIGHYYWDRLIRDSDLVDSFRQFFGDERQDYSAALKKHYEEGPPDGWHEEFVTAYACAHPWEDWAETFAHYLHMADTLETASFAGLSLRPRRNDEPAIKTPIKASQDWLGTFDQLIQSWFPLTYLLNNLNRGMGLADAYPFVLAPPAVEKLRFVHECIAGANA